MFVKESDYSFCSVVGRTDVGCKRSVNEDSIGRADTPNGLAVVICDGMGGNVGGKTASETAVGAILQHLREHLYNNPQEAVSNAIQEANKAVLKKVSLRPELTGMGCTCVLLLIGKSGTVNIGHVGDSRIYLIRDGMANHLTKDQSYVQMLVDEGRLTPQEAEHHPRNNEITNAVGMMNMTPPVIRERAINPVAGDCFLLCSDGLSKLVPEEDIVKIVSARSFSTERRAEMLIDAAKNNGGSDNISVQLVEFSVTPAEVRMANDKKRLVILSASVVLAVILFLLGFFIINGGDKEKNINSANCESVGKSVVTEEKQDDGKESDGLSISTILSNTDSDSCRVKSSGGRVGGGDYGYTNVGPNVDQNASAVAQSESDTSNKYRSKESISNHFIGKTMTFPADKDTLSVDPPHSSSKRVNKEVFKYSKCCDKPQSDFRNRLVDVIETPDGGLKIIKTDRNNEVPSWKGYSILINKYVSRKQEPQEMSDQYCIKIVFE